jgi:hypothetical protein
MRHSFALAQAIIALMNFAVCAHGRGADLTATPLAGDGELVKLHDLTEKIFQFKIESGQLRIDRAAWDREGKEFASAEAAQAAAATNNMPPGFVQNPRMLAMDKERRDRTIATMGGPPPALHAIFRVIEQRARQASRSFMGEGGDLPSSSIHNGWKEWQSGFVGEGLVGDLRTNNGGEELLLQEQQPPRRMLEFRAGSDGSMLLQLTDRDGNTIVLRQNGQGQFVLAIVADKTTSASEAESFIACFKQHRQQLESEVLPVLAKIGIRPILSTEAAEVREAVLASLLRGSQARAEGQRLLSDLDDDSYEVREAASMALSKRFALFGDIIREKLSDKTNSAEVQSRLQRIVADQSDSELPARTAEALGLAGDPAYLVNLLDLAADRELPVVVSRLEQITGQRLGSDRAAWKTWVRSHE